MKAWMALMPGHSFWLLPLQYSNERLEANNEDKTVDVKGEQCIDGAGELVRLRQDEMRSNIRKTITERWTLGMLRANEGKIERELDDQSASLISKGTNKSSSITTTSSYILNILPFWKLHLYTEACTAFPLTSSLDVFGIKSRGGP